MAEMRFCSKCKKTMSDINFYTYRDGTKCELCKSCLTMHINNYETDTYLWLLEKFDVPYVEAEWKNLREKEYEKAYNKVLNSSGDINKAKTAAYNLTKGNSVVFGKYLSKMKLKQWKNYFWADTERIKTELEEKEKLYGTKTEEMQEKLEEMKERYLKGEISEAQYMTYNEVNADEQVHQSLEEQFLSGGQPQEEQTQDSAYPVNEHPFEEVQLVDVSADLTDEDKVYLAMKWGRLYRADEWVALEKLYNEFMNSFDIQGAARTDTLKKICKTSLKMDQAIDCGDIETYQKLARVYDSMMKSAKFTEAQNKDGKSDFLDSVGEMVAYCEKNGGQIPKYEIETPFDVVDKIIDDLKEYNKSLIYEDKSLAEEIEQYLKNKEISESMKRDREEAKAKGLSQVELEDEDYLAFKEAMENDIQHDTEVQEGEEDI